MLRRSLAAHQDQDELEEEEEEEVNVDDRVHSVKELPVCFQQLFPEFRLFNVVQSATFRVNPTVVHWLVCK
jgi:hypothetical protein